MSHLVFDGLVTDYNLGSEFIKVGDKYVLKLDPTITKAADGTLHANVSGVATAGGLALNGGAPIDLTPLVKAGETLTTIGYDPLLKKITYTGENGTPVVIDLSALATDVFITGTTYDAATMVLTLTDNSATTPDITLNLAELKKIVTANSASVSFTGTGEASSPLTATVTSIPAGVTIPAAQVTGQTVSNTIAGAGAARTLSTTVNGVVGAPVPLPETVIPATTVSNSITGVWPAPKVLTTTVNGVTSAPISFNDQDAQQVSIAGIGIAPEIAISNGNSVKLPIYSGSGPGAGLVPAQPAAPFVGKFLQADGTWTAPVIPATTHVNKWTKADGLKQTVNGIASDTPIPVGVIADTIGYDAAGNPVSQALGVQPDFFTSAVGAPDVLGSPNGVTDRTEKIRRDGHVGLNTNPLTTLDVAGSHSIGYVSVLTNATTPYVVTPLDSVLMMNGSTDQVLIWPDAAAFPRRILTVRTEWQLTNARVTINGIPNQLEHLGGARFPSISLDNRAVASVTYQAMDGYWRLIDWTARRFYPTTGYTAPANAATFNGSGGVQPAPGVPFQIPATAPAWNVVDGNYTGLVALPATPNASGYFSVYASNSPGFSTTIATTSTDLPQAVIVPSGGQSMHFEWSGGLWRWVESPTAPPAPIPTVVKNTNTALSGGYTVPSQTVVGSVTTYTNLVTIPQSTPITIPAPANYPKNTELYLKTTGAWVGSIVVTPAGGQIDQATTYTINKPSALLKPSVTFMHDGFNWYAV